MKPHGMLKYEITLPRLHNGRKYLTQLNDFSFHKEGTWGRLLLCEGTPHKAVEHKYQFLHPIMYGKYSQNGG
jgi:hypothetical protein